MRQWVVLFGVVAVLAGGAAAQDQAAAPQVQEEAGTAQPDASETAAPQAAETDAPKAEGQPEQPEAAPAGSAKPVAAFWFLIPGK
ncbi:MAG TPA: hypothetical protein PKI11_12470 [Candidatus Hydrogenedentes bacterium]|nr:hypothetical protein [Candidatus Hydrogenedentota bacterium]